MNKRLNLREVVALDLWSVETVLVFGGVVIRHTINFKPDDGWEFSPPQDEPSLELLDVFNDLSV